MEKYHTIHKTIDQYHGKQNIGSSYKYIVKVSQQTLSFTLFVTLLTFYPHISTSRCMLSLIHTTLDSIPIENPCWRKLENQIVEAIGPTPQMDTMTNL